LNWFKQIQKNSESAGSNFVANSGEYAFLAENRIQLPSIGIELSNSRRMSPFALGGGQVVFTDFMIHCVAEDSYTRDNMVDIIMLQNEKVIFGYDLDSIAASGDFPVDYRGVPSSGAKQYPELVQVHPGTEIRIINPRLDSVYALTPEIHVGTVKITTECILFGV
jgi:hypothetical protein